MVAGLTPALLCMAAGLRFIEGIRGSGSIQPGFVLTYRHTSAPVVREMIIMDVLFKLCFSKRIKMKYLMSVLLQFVLFCRAEMKL